MTYVDLNPVRAVMADSPELSDYTSIQERLGITPDKVSAIEVEHDSNELPNSKNSIPEAPLQAFAGDEHIDNDNNLIPFHLLDYMELVDWTGRCLRDDKRGVIDDGLPPILERFNIRPEQWLQSCGNIEKHYFRAIGPVAKLEQLTEKLGLKWLQGKVACSRFYASPSSA